MREKLVNISTLIVPVPNEKEDGLQLRFRLKFVRLRHNINAEPVTHSMEKSVQIDRELASQILGAISRPGSEVSV